MLAVSVCWVKSTDNNYALLSSTAFDLCPFLGLKMTI